MLSTAIMNKKKKTITKADEKTRHYEHGSTMGKTMPKGDKVNKPTFQEAIKNKYRG